ncbi:hypothetical protein SBD_2107 [Streptomyces bottropensis ATCC 25435]|uniref:Uncharacterized protein n=1 Tax=Streptomyces bottropensis ATCC 25435 TaxID=1054862 RepID=M3EJJ2_9ACTN|nr:hypothetical protein SBD_2107 [Streptomyces bottropensis ATCC 25435]
MHVCHSPTAHGPSEESEGPIFEEDSKNGRKIYAELHQDGSAVLADNLSWKALRSGRKGRGAADRGHRRIRGVHSTPCAASTSSTPPAGPGT